MLYKTADLDQPKAATDLYKRMTHCPVGGRVASTPERAVRVRTLAGDIVLCFWARHFTLTVLHSTDPGV